MTGSIELASISLPIYTINKSCRDLSERKHFSNQERKHLAVALEKVP